MIVRRRFRFLPSVVGPYRFLQSPPCLQRILPRIGDSVVRLTTRESHECRAHLLQHKLQVLHSSVLVRVRRKNSRSIAVVVISVGCSAAHSNIISDSLIIPAKNASVFLDHCWKSSSGPVNSFGRPRPFHLDETRSVFPNLCCREIVDCSHCIDKSRFCHHLSSESDWFLLKLCNNSLHSSSTSLLLRTRFHQCSSLRFATRRLDKQPRSRKQGPPENTTPQLSAHRQLSTTQTRNRATILRSPGALRNVSRCVTNHHATMMK